MQHNTDDDNNNNTIIIEIADNVSSVSANIQGETHVEEPFARNAWNREIDCLSKLWR